MRLNKLKLFILTSLILTIISIYPSTILAQTVAVTGTITDTQTTPYSNGLLTVTFVNSTGQQATFGGNPSFQKSYAIYLDANGAFTISLPPNSTASPSIQPSGTQWNFSYQSQGGYGAANINVTITGAGSISGTLSNLARITWPYGNIPPPGAAGQGIVFVSSTTLGWGTTGTAGAVTHTAGNLTALHLMLGNGLADSTVDSACVTNGTGALSGCTSITTPGTVAANALTSTTSMSVGSGASAAGATATGGFACVEAASTGWTPTVGQDYIRCDSTLHSLVSSSNGVAEALLGGAALSGLTAATASNTIANGNNPQTWNWAQTTDSQDGIAFGETSAATNGTLTNGLANQAVHSVSSLTNSTATPFEVVQGAITNTVATPAMQIESTWNNAGGTFNELLLNVVDTARSATSCILKTNPTVSGLTTCLDVSGQFVGQRVFTSAANGLQLFTSSHTTIIDAGNVTGAMQVEIPNTSNDPTNATLEAGFCGNVTPVTVNANVSTFQLLMSCALGANNLNLLLRKLRVTTSGVYTTTAANASTMTIAVKLCTVSGCGSGTVITPCTWTSSVGAGGQTGNPFNTQCIITTQTAGASAAFEAHGNMTMDMTGVGVAASVFPDTNAATVGTIDSTAALFLQVTGTFSVASGSNSFTERDLTIEMIN